jgi:hypothetical protein
MDGRLISSTNYAMKRALPSLSSSPRVPESSEDSLNRAGMLFVGLIGRQTRKHSYFQLRENRFTGSLMLSLESNVALIMALALEHKH